jgi:uncharacterized protein YbjT (DUF2867 family)
VRIAVAGATGNIGARTVEILGRDGHDVVRISRKLGVDLLTGSGLDDALAGVETVVDVTNGSPASFGTITANLLAAEQRAGVGHHVLLSIVGIGSIEDNEHYAGKREQESLVTAGPVPWTIVPATQFHDFAEMTAQRAEHDGVARVAPLLMQPIAPQDVAEILAEVAVGRPQGRHVDVAGPETQDLVDLARRTQAKRGREVKLVPTWEALFGLSMAGNALLPAQDARIAPTTFDEWLDAIQPAS